MWLTNNRAVLPETVLERAAILVEGEWIAEIREGDPPAGRWARVVDGHGLTALPGLIDLHGDMVEREIEPRSGALFPTDLAIHELDKRLAACGVTTAYAALSLWDVDRPASVRGRDKVRETVLALNRLRPALLVDHMVHARYEVSTPSSADLLGELLANGLVHMVSLMDHTPGQGQYRDVDRYIDYIARHRGADHSVVARETAERVRQAEEAAATNWALAQSVVAIAHADKLPIASHDDDTPAKVELVAGLGATIAEFPVAMEAAAAARAGGMHVVMGAPNVLRGGSHSGNLNAAEAIAAGVVDTLAADYYPAAMLHAAFQLERKGTLPLHEAVRLVSLNPADALGLHDRGQLTAGCQADIALVEAGETPRVRATLRAGRAIFSDGTLTIGDSREL